MDGTRCPQNLCMYPSWGTIFAILPQILQGEPVLPTLDSDLQFPELRERMSAVRSTPVGGPSWTGNKYGLRPMVGGLKRPSAGSRDLSRMKPVYSEAFEQNGWGFGLGTQWNPSEALGGPVHPPGLGFLICDVGSS